MGVVQARGCDTDGWADTTVACYKVGISTVAMGKTWATEHLGLVEMIVVDILKYYN